MDVNATMFDRYRLISLALTLGVEHYCTVRDSIRLQYTTEPRKMGLRMDAFSVRAVSEPHRRRQR